MMIRPLIVAVPLALTLLAAPAQAACYADYKAKQDKPLRLHYGVIKVPDRACDANAAARVIQRRISGDGWELLNVLGVFDDSGLDQRKASAGQYFLRY